MSNDDTLPTYRSIVLCFDGTGDWVEHDRTNVAKIFEVLDREDQLAYYDAGVGTLGDSQALGDGQQKALNLIDLGTATSMGEKVTQAYAYLVRNYRPGVKIYMIGFSRGAYTARILAGMLYNFGLLRPELEHLAPYFYQSVASVDTGKRKPGATGPSAAILEFKEKAKRLHQDFCREETIEVEFMGLFDTVTSVGIIDRFRVFPNTDRNAAVRRTCHAVSIEESRNAFPESLMHPNQPNLTEVWFPGVHRDCGGGIDPLKSRIADEALAWIEKEAQAAGLGLLSLHVPDRGVLPDPNYSEGFDPYVLLGFYPQKMFVKRVSDFRVLWPNFRHVRVIPEGALVHEIVDEVYSGKPGGSLPPNMPDRWVRFKTGDQAFSKGPYVLRQIGLNAEDVVGIVLGSVLLSQLWNAEVGCPFGASIYGVSWPIAHLPTPLGWVELLLCFAFMLGQAAGKGQFSPKFRSRVRPLLDRALPVVGLLVAAAGLALIVLPTVAERRLPKEGAAPVLLGLAVGLVAAVTAQCGRLPVVRADRTLPYLLRNGFYAAVLLKGIHHVVSWWMPWRVPLWVAAGVLAAAVSVAVVQIFRERPLMAKNDTKETPSRRGKTEPVSQ